MKNALKLKIAKWRKTVGYDEAKKRLVDAGVSNSTAQKLLAGTYEASPRGLLLKAITEGLSMKYVLFLFVILISFKVQAAQDEWLCTSQGVIRDGRVFQACGVGEGASEGRARTKALDAAIAEFTTVCNASADCDINRVSMSPQRMSCYQDKGTGFLSGGWKCTRLIVVTIGGI